MRMSRKKGTGRRKLNARGRGYAETNPLVGWEYVGQRPEMRDVDRASRPMYSKNAPQVFEEKLRTTLLDIHVIVGDEPESTAAKSRLIEHIHSLVDEGKTVLWMRRPLRDTLLSGTKDAEEVRRRLDLPRGAGILRISPMTPFALLHRMGDALRSYHNIAGWKVAPRVTETWFDLIGFAFHRLETINYTLVTEANRMTAADRYRLYSTGVNTLAGRSGWFRDWKEATSDLWAKYILTGKIDYDPDAGGPWTPEQLNARRDYAESLYLYFPKLLELSQGNVFLVSE